MINRLLVEYVKKVPLQEIIEYYNIKITKGYISCIFHEERTPSAKLYEETNRGYCFGCHKLFDSIEVVKKLENVSFEEAVLFIYKNFATTMFGLKKEEKENISLFCKLNDELKDLINIVAQNKEKRMKLAGIMQTIDMNAQNNLLILKIYQNLLEMIK